MHLNISLIDIHYAKNSPYIRQLLNTTLADIEKKKESRI